MKNLKETLNIFVSFNSIHFMSPVQIVEKIYQANSFLKIGGKAFFIFEQPYSYDIPEYYIETCIDEINKANSTNSNCLCNKCFPSFYRYTTNSPSFSIYRYQKKSGMLFPGHMTEKLTDLSSSYIGSAINKSPMRMHIPSLFTLIELKQFLTIANSMGLKTIKSSEFTISKDEKGKSFTKIFSPPPFKGGHHEFAGCVLQKSEEELDKSIFKKWIIKAEKDEKNIEKLHKGKIIAHYSNPVKYPFYEVVDENFKK